MAAYNSGDNKFAVPASAYYAMPSSSAAAAASTTVARVNKRSSSSLVQQPPTNTIIDDDGNVIRPLKIPRGILTTDAALIRSMARLPTSAPTFRNLINDRFIQPHVESFLGSPCDLATGRGTKCDRAWTYVSPSKKRLDCSNYCSDPIRCPDWLADALQFPPTSVSFWMRDQYGTKVLAKRIKEPNVSIQADSDDNLRTIRGYYDFQLKKWSVVTITTNDAGVEHENEVRLTPAEFALKLCKILAGSEVGFTPVIDLKIYLWRDADEYTVPFAKQRDWNDILNVPVADVNVTFDGTRHADSVWIRPDVEWTIETDDPETVSFETVLAPTDIRKPSIEPYAGVPVVPEITAPSVVASAAAAPRTPFVPMDPTVARPNQMPTQFRSALQQRQATAASTIRRTGGGLISGNNRFRPMQIRSFF